MNDVMEANSSKCLQDQKMLLLQLKNNLTYDSEISLHLAYWDDTIDFCEWKGKRIDVRNSGLSPMKPLEFVSSQVSEFGLEIEQVSSV
ncbi:hypothetical protein T459_23134 [Capsicum annuum]|uniref:Leucine-rich repeat-containing N-terminal plant-type domain-containing protein n=1 Tax=Capsicum annuum TaxID=4072 RepID=A0A2G2YRI4_CAPAN|nr:hypothetical protein T459_23134 [Capsicum annuum]